MAKAYSRKLAVGRDVRVEGVISRRDGDSITLMESGGSQVSITLNGSTRILERKRNPFRDANTYRPADLVVGLKLEARGYGGAAGDLVAREIRMREDDRIVADSIQTRVAPVEGRLGATENRLKLAENETELLSGQVKELSIVSAGTRRDVAAAHEKADAARAAANGAAQAVRAANDRIGTLDDFDTDEPLVVLFKVGSAELEPEAVQGLDQLAERAKALKGYQLEVRGFASSDGGDELNRRLSRNRADAVVRYFVEKHEIPLRRILLPHGYGESQPVADNSTRDGRRQNRRVEVRILLNRGLTEKAAQVAAGSGPEK